jgi:hypothetical protein
MLRLPRMAAPIPPRDPLFEVEQLSLAYDGFGGQPPASILKKVSVTVELGQVHAAAVSQSSGRTDRG